ncbi:hypothetical protein [Streptomyces virginiae]|uniref:hypothetical protein n=1 Tax=Streptomyces virginiae TaxID=1961 RepID=UPI00224D1B27|nr:hypothetical protein [Streptomyces virginiae]MCX5174098.1 hypothetical protein [Streptomyces virginiae]
MPAADKPTSTTWTPSARTREVGSEAYWGMWAAVGAAHAEGDLPTAVAVASEPEAAPAGRFDEGAATHHQLTAPGTVPLAVLGEVRVIDRFRSGSGGLRVTPGWPARLRGTAPIRDRGHRGSRQVVRKHLAALRAGNAEPVRAGEPVSVPGMAQAARRPCAAARAARR